MPADVALRQRTIDGVGQRVHPHIGVGMADQPAVMRQLDPAQKHPIPRPESMHVIPVAQSHIHAGSPFCQDPLGPRHVAGPGQFQIILVAGGDAHRNAAALHQLDIIGSVGAAHLEDSFRTNASGPFLLTQALAPLLADGARVANLSSRLGSIGTTARFSTPSCNISKAALNMATVLLAQALADRGIVVVAFSPGWVRTDMGGSDADVAPEDAVAGVLRQVDALQTGDSGRFLGTDGAAIPW